jgi:hypothetical protein
VLMPSRKLVQLSGLDVADGEFASSPQLFLTIR